MTDKPILCPTCRHGVDAFKVGTGSVTCAVHLPWTRRACGCDHSPDRIARVLLAAPPTDAEVEAAAEFAWADDIGDEPHPTGSEWDDWKRLVRGMLTAAAEARAGR